MGFQHSEAETHGSFQGFWPQRWGVLQPILGLQLQDEAWSGLRWKYQTFRERYEITRLHHKGNESIFDHKASNCQKFKGIIVSIIYQCVIIQSNDCWW